MQYPSTSGTVQFNHIKNPTIFPILFNYYIIMSGSLTYGALRSADALKAGVLMSGMRMYKTLKFGCSNALAPLFRALMSQTVNTLPTTYILSYPCSRPFHSTKGHVVIEQKYRFQQKSISVAPVLRELVSKKNF